MVSEAAWIFTEGLRTAALNVIITRIYSEYLHLYVEITINLCYTVCVFQIERNCE